MKIKLGKLPGTRAVRMTILVPEALKVQLDHYAQLYSQTWDQQVDAAKLVPHILTQFLVNDRAFQQSEKAKRQNANIPLLEANSADQGDSSNHG